MKTLPRIRTEGLWDGGTQLWAVHSSRTEKGSVLSCAVRCFGRIPSRGEWIVADDGQYDLRTLSEKDVDRGSLVAIVYAESARDAMRTQAAQEIIRSLHGRVSLSKKKRYEILARDNFRCRYCGASADSGAVLHVDHVVPFSRGGSDSDSNLVASCEDCNLGKGARFSQSPPGHRHTDDAPG